MDDETKAYFAAMMAQISYQFERVLNTLAAGRDDIRAMRRRLGRIEALVSDHDADQTWEQEQIDTLTAKIERLEEELRRK